MNTSTIETLRPVQYEIIKELAKLTHALKAPLGVQAAIGSWGDTLTEEEVLELLVSERQNLETLLP